MTDKLEAGCTKLQQLKHANVEASVVLPVLQHLAGIPISVELLKHTHAGREVNQSWLRLHKDEAVRHMSGALVRHWKSVVRLESAKNNVTEPVTPVKTSGDGSKSLELTPKLEEKVISNKPSHGIKRSNRELAVAAFKLTIRSPAVESFMDDDPYCDSLDDIFGGLAEFCEGKDVKVHTDFGSSHRLVHRFASAGIAS